MARESIWTMEPGNSCHASIEIYSAKYFARPRTQRDALLPSPGPPEEIIIWIANAGTPRRG